MVTFVLVGIFVCAAAFLLVPIQHGLSDTITGVLLFVAAWFCYLLGEVALLAGVGPFYAQSFPALGSLLGGFGLLLLVFADDRTPPEPNLPARPPRR